MDIDEPPGEFVNDADALEGVAVNEELFGYDELFAVVGIFTAFAAGMFIPPLDLNDEDKFEVAGDCCEVGVDFLKNLFKFDIELCLVGDYH